MSRMRGIVLIFLALDVLLVLGIVALWVTANIACEFMDADGASTINGVLLNSAEWFGGPIGKGILTLFLLAGMVFLIVCISVLAGGRTAPSPYSRLEFSVETYAIPLHRVDVVLRFLELFLPARVMKEDAGDAREAIHKMHAEQGPVWMIYTKLTSAVFWILLAAFREFLTISKKKPS